MALITRISRLFTADMHAVIDRLEEPDLVLKQALRDMQDTVAVGRNRVQGLRVQAQTLGERATEARNQLPPLEQELAVCLDANDDALARNVIRRKLQVQATIEAVSARQRDVQRAVEEGEQRLDEQVRELESLRQKSELVDLPNPPTSAPVNISAEQVEIALLQVKQRRQPS